MEKNDKTALIGVVAALIVVVFAIICIKGTRYLPLGWIGIIVVLVEFVVAALVCKKVMEIAGETTSLWPIPIYSTVSIFQKSFIIATLIEIALVAINTLLLVANVNPFGFSDTGLMFSKYLGIAEYLFITVLSFTVGIGYFDVLRQVNQLLHKYNRGLKTVWVSILFLCIPVIRVVGLIQIYNASSSLVLAMDKNDLDGENYDYVETE